MHVDPAMRAQLLAEIPSLRAYARSLTHDAVYADDLVQETLIKAWSKMDHFERVGMPSHPAPFGNMVIIYGADGPMIERMLAEFHCVHLPRSARVGRIGSGSDGAG